MGGRFIFALRNQVGFDHARWIQALRDARKLKAPSEMYISYDGPSHGGMGLVVKVQQRQDWTLIVPLDPTKDEIECGFTYGVVSRKKVWECLRELLVSLCRAAPFAFEFSYEDRDLGEYKEVGYFCYQTNSFIVEHKGLPPPAEMERIASGGNLAEMMALGRKSMPITTSSLRSRRF